MYIYSEYNIARKGITLVELKKLYTTAATAAVAVEITPTRKKEKHKNMKQITAKQQARHKVRTKKKSHPIPLFHT